MVAAVPLWVILFGAAVGLAGTPEAARLATRGLQALEAGRLGEAQRAFEEARRLEPTNIHYAMGLAQVHVSAGKLGQAVPLLQECLRRLPGDYDVRFTLAQVYVNIGEDLEASRLLEGTLPPEPRTATWLFIRGFALFRLGDYEGAKASFERLLQYRDMRAPANFFLANCFASEGRYADSLLHYERALEFGNRADNKALNAYYHNYGLALFRLAQYDRAAVAFEASTRLYPRDPLPQYFLGRCLAETQRRSGAIAAFEAVVRAQPDFGPAYYRLAILYSQQGDKAKSREMFRKVADLKQEELEHSEREALRLRTAGP